MSAVAATTVAVAVVASRSLERRLVRGESMRPALDPGDTVVVVRCRSWAGRFLRPRVGRIALVQLPWEHDRVGVKRLVGGPGEPWSDGADSVAAGPGWVVVGDQRVLSTDSRHHGRVPDDAVLGIVVGRVRAPGRPDMRHGASGRGRVHA